MIKIKNYCVWCIAMSITWVDRQCQISYIEAIRNALKICFKNITLRIQDIVLKFRLIILKSYLSFHNDLRYYQERIKLKSSINLSVVYIKRKNVLCIYTQTLLQEYIDMNTEIKTKC